MGQSLNDDVKISVVMAHQDPGTSDINSSIIDMIGYDGVMFVAVFSVLSANQATGIAAQEGNLSDGSDADFLAGSGVGPLSDTDSNKGLLVNIVRPRKRYVRCVVRRENANAEVSVVIAIQHGPTVKPTVHDASIVAQKVLVSPSIGTP
jgi:hypothetical protein